MLDLFFFLSIFLFGLIIGSFLNCVIYRLETDDNPLKGRSYCPKCKHTLIWKDLIPVFSFIFLKGSCRYCQKKISWQYPLVEIATGLLFVLIFNQLFVGDYLSFFYYLIIAALLIIIFVVDLKHYIIPDKIVYLAIIVALAFNLQYLFLNQFLVFKNSVMSAVLAAGFFLAIVLITKGKGMGIGDIKLAFFMGLFLSWPNILVALFLAFSIGAIIGAGMIIAKNKTLKSEMPFGPFLITGTFMALFLGEQVINWYLNLFI